MSIPEFPKFYRDAELSRVRQMFSETDGYSAPERPVVDEFDVLNQVQVAILKIAAEARVITAAREFTRLSKTSVDPDSDIWFDHQRRLFDAMDALDGAS